MKLVETSAIPVFDLPLQAAREHLRTGTGFSDDAVQDGLLEGVLRAALAAIEARTGKALLERSFRWHVEGWRSQDEQALPIAPVSAVTGITLVGPNGDQTPVEPNCYTLVEDSQRPFLSARCHSLPRIPTGGRAEVSFVAGYAATWEGLPADLKQAVLMMAAFFYENRGDTAIDDGNMPLSVTLLTERYRTIRFLGGAVS